MVHWLTILTVVGPLISVASAVISFWQAREARLARLETQQAREESQRELLSTAFRAALREQLENCRHSGLVNLSIGGSAQLQRLSGWEPSFDHLNALFDPVKLEQALVAYLIWLVGRVRQEIKDLEPDIERIIQAKQSGSYAAQDQPETLDGRWATILDRLQLLPCLLRAEARRQELADVADSFGAHWLEPRPAPEHERVSREAHDRAFLGAPYFPRNATCTDCSPEARDRRAAELHESQKAWLTDEIHRGL